MELLGVGSFGNYAVSAFSLGAIEGLVNQQLQSSW